MTRHDLRRPRLYLPVDLAEGGEAELDRAQDNYLRNVLRLEAGAELLVFNGREGEWLAELIPSARRGARIRLSCRTRGQPMAPDLMLAFAPLKHVRLDHMVQKAVEMGTGIMQPVLTRRTQVARVNLGRIRANAVEAAEQCGILSVPVVAEPAPLARWLAALAPERVLVLCDEEAETSDPLGALARAPEGPIAALVGPEGGFDDAEREMLMNRERTVRLSLGPRVLRADTAAVAVLALVQAVRGDWR
jgi:16S rRNA (uracil1498-N3)-methyltransferase